MKKKFLKNFLKSGNDFPMNPPEANISDMTLSDIASKPGVNLSVNTDKKELEIQEKTPDGIKNYKYQVSDTGRRTAKITEVPIKDNKKDYLQDILEMRAAGEKQEDIAHELGISQGYVSRLLKKHKEK